jgi:2-keto-3-deoxy-L-rhamnonate aldolase RhmA
MTKIVNKIRQAFKEGRPSFGMYVTTPSPRAVEQIGFAGFDFVRIDMDSAVMNIETVQNMIFAAHASGVTPIVRVPLDLAHAEWHIGAALQMGAMGIIIPRVTCRADAESAVRAVKTLPFGEYKALPNEFTGGFGQMSFKEHVEWANENIILSVQVETKSGVEAIDEIVSIPGLDMVQSGRNDLSYDYGVPGQGFHPLVLEAQQKVIQAGLKAGKLTSVQYYPLRDPKHIDIVRDFIRQGVQCLSLGDDKDVVSVYRRVLEGVRAS